MDSFEEYVDWLIDFLEENENKEIVNYAGEEFRSYYCEVAPKNRVGDESIDESARPTVLIVIDEKEKVAQLRRIYLNNRRQGIGTKIVNQLIEFCMRSGIKEVWFCDITTPEGEDFFWTFGYDKKVFSYNTLAETWKKFL